MNEVNKFGAEAIAKVITHKWERESLGTKQKFMGVAVKLQSNIDIQITTFQKQISDLVEA